MSEDHDRLAGWVSLDLRMLSILLIFSSAVAILVLALHFKGRRWDEYVVGFAAVFCIALISSLILTNVLAVFPAFRVESLFAVR